MRLFAPLALVALALSSVALAQAVPYTLPDVRLTDGSPRSSTATFSLPLGQPQADCSGTVTTGGTSQQVAPANTKRNLLIIQNPATATEILVVNWTGAASTTSASIELAAGGSLFLSGNTVPPTAINVNAATTGHRFICKVGG